MAFKNTSLKDYYNLKRESFSLDPFRDKGIYFGDSALATRITDRIQSDFLDARSIPKFFVHGYFGSGKTHTLLHIAHLLETPPFAEMYPTEPIYLDIAPLTIKEEWKKVHGRFLDAIGLDRTSEAVERAADAIEGADKAAGFRESGAVRFGDEALKVSQAEVFRNLLFGGKQRHKSWEWMKGRKLSADDADTLGTQKQLSEPQDLVNCLLNLGAVFQAGTGKRIVLLVDEAEAFEQVTNVDSINEIRHALRMLLENSNPVVGLVMAVQAEGSFEEMGDIFTRGDVRRRIGYEQGYIDLNSLLFEVNQPDEFVRKTLRYLVDQDMAAKVIEDEGLATDSSMYPFTEDAVQAIETHALESPERATPSQILSYMSNSAIDAWRKREEISVHVLVDQPLVEGAAFPGEPAA